ncbi:SMEK domain-containing protein [Clostridium sp.]|uniref:SMEK domain-containing protein n=1 Tax=Clostridium sp. TaxID=1506 RepID=UPI001A3C1614|nr:SMEK domain-containing protein [Clostridium sp.]MBK5242047.1 SMEK domain-containing protein [Clostridium sp.]
MMNKEIYLKNVAESLALLSKRVELLNAVNLYDINIIAEDFFAGLLNLIFDYKLKNVNVIEKNAPAIDLIDEENKISIQVTSDNSSTKIKHTISEYIDNKSYDKYDRLIVLILTRKKKYSALFDTNDKFVFNNGSDILDIEDLVKFTRGLQTEKIREINDFLEMELCEKVYSAKKTQANEIDTIIDLIEYISKHKKVKKKIDVEVDPEYKIFKRFKDFAEKLILEYTTLYIVYGNAIETINETIGIDEAQDIIIVFYLQDISMHFLDETNDNPIKALNKLVDYFEDKLSVNGKKYDRAAIKFYLINEMIKCRVFPNEREEYNGSK